MFASTANHDDDSILRGKSAQLSGIRAALLSENEALLTAALDPFLRDEGDDDENHEATNVPATPLYQERNVTLSWQIDSEESVSCQGFLVITQHACLFCAIPTSSNRSSIDNNSATVSAANDWYIPATSISLHALTAGDEGSVSSPSGVYLQIENPQDDESNPIEWTVQSTDASTLFTALSKLVSLHPIDPHQDTNNDMYGNNDDDENFEPEDMIWASDFRDDDDDDDDDEGAATREERQAMLDRLDQVLIVPPEYEIDDNDEGKQQDGMEGQFDDADEDDEML